ncbi:MAG TPA: ribbon-helix-helix protein, CopG family [Anaeromyxobacteraceae bacterium]|nr:ribbon-helix-helix protein, CopG family [Anaeromyxobacteraceae bacterium]
MATLTVRLSVALRRDLDRLARQRGRPAGELVRDSLERYLAIERFRALRAKTLPRAAERGFLTDEDVFKATK